MSVVTKTVVLIEDSRTQSRHYAKLLESIGYDMRDFDTPQKFIDVLDKLELPAVVLSDLYLPRMSGVDVLRHLLTHEMWCTVPCILMSGWAQHKDLEAAHRLRVPPEGFLVKPVDSNTLSDTLHAILFAKRPIHLLRQVQRSQIELELRTRRIDRAFGARLSELSHDAEEVAKTITRLDSELAAIRAYGPLAETQQAEGAAELEELQNQLVAARDRSRMIRRIRGDVLADLRKLAADANHESKLLEARLRTAHDVVDNAA